MMQKTNSNISDVNKIVDKDFNNQKFKVCWTWYLFLLSNFLVIIGAAIYLVIYLKNFPNESGTKPADIFLNAWMYPTIFNSVSILVMLVFAFYEVKEIIPLRFHTKWKWYKFIFAALISYLFMLIFAFIFVSLTHPSGVIDISVINRNMPIVLLSILMVWALATIILYRYGRFHIDQDIFRRRHGIEVTEKIKHDQKRNTEREKIDKASGEEFKKMRDSINDTKDDSLKNAKATSGLFDKMKQDE